MSEVVTYERDGDIAIVTINNPPVNALGAAVRTGLKESFDRFAADDARIAMIVGGGNCFIGGADITEFGKPIEGPDLAGLCMHIERIGKPVVSAIHGFALGGGLEVALGTHYRLAAESAIIGLPETDIGLIPGAGGTQKLVRLTGVETALQIVPAGGRVPAKVAEKAGVVDRVVKDGGDIRADGLAYAKELLGGNAEVREVGALPRPKHDAAAFEKARAFWKKKSPGEVARLISIDAVEAACNTDIDEGMEAERKFFKQAHDSPQRVGMVYAFFNDRQVSRLPELKGVEPRKHDHIGVIGGGTMGSGISTACLFAGLKVTLVEQNAEAAGKALERVTGNIDGAVKRGKLPADKRDAVLGLISCVDDYNALADVDLCIEAVFEDMDLKKETFKKIDGIIRDGAVLATNTSYLDVDEIAAVTKRPGDVIGMHFFSPAHVMRLLEIVVGDNTALDTVATAFSLAKKIRKVGVRAGVCDGFIGNRILSNYQNAVTRMILDGASPWEVDDAVKAFGMPMGPFEMGDLAGLDIGYLVKKRKLAEGADPKEAPTDWVDQMVENNWLGRKTGRGYYNYDGDPVPNSEISPMIEATRKGINRKTRKFSPEEIQRRYMVAMVNEASKVLEDGIARRALDVDVTMLYGYGFPRWRGGPLLWADMEGIEGIAKDIKAWAEEDPKFWQISPLLEKLAKEGGKFADYNK